MSRGEHLERGFEKAEEQLLLAAELTNGDERTAWLRDMAAEVADMRTRDDVDPEDFDQHIAALLEVQDASDGQAQAAIQRALDVLLTHRSFY